MSYRVEFDDRILSKFKERFGFNLIDVLKELGARFIKEENESKFNRFIVLNEGAHDIRSSILKQFGEHVEVLVASHGNLNQEEIKEVALKVANIYDPERDVIVLSGPTLLAVLTAMYIHVKAPTVIRLAQYDLSRKSYNIYELSHLGLRKDVHKYKS